MIEECAPDAKIVVRTHCIQAMRNRKMAQFSKGTGSPKRPSEARGEEYVLTASKVARQLGLAPACANKHIPGLLEE